MTADEKQRIMQRSREAGFDQLSLNALAEVLDDVSKLDDFSVVGASAEKIAAVVVEALKQENIRQFPELPHIISNASINAAMGVEHLRMVRGGIEVFRAINRQAVESVVPHINSAEATFVKIRDSLHQTSQLLIGEELDQNKEGLHG